MSEPIRSMPPSEEYKRNWERVFGGTPRLAPVTLPGGATVNYTQTSFNRGASFVSDRTIYPGRPHTMRGTGTNPSGKPIPGGKFPEIEIDDEQHHRKGEIGKQSQPTGSGEPLNRR